MGASCAAPQATRWMAMSGGDPLRHRSGNDVKAQRIGAEILTTLPLTPATRNEIRRS